MPHPRIVTLDLAQLIQLEESYLRACSEASMDLSALHESGVTYGPLHDRLVRRLAGLDYQLTRIRERKEVLEETSIVVDHGVLLAVQAPPPPVRRRSEVAL